MGTKEAALKGADTLVIFTEWQSFRAPDFDVIKEEFSEAVIFDGRNMFEPELMQKKGFNYYCIERALLVIGSNW